ncbi:MAG: hypothetical protein Q9191_001353 [Dirinaria sp. TL-2023a]
MAPALRGYMSPPAPVPSTTFPGPEGVDIDGHGSPDHRSASAQLANRKTPVPYQQKRHPASSNYFESSASEDVNPLFDFEPRSLTGSPRKQVLMPSTPFPIANGWDSIQPPSPPNSAVYPSENWRPFDYKGQVPHNILTQIDPSRARSHYGQTTPPDDDASSIAEAQLSRQPTGLPTPERSTTANGKKRKQASANVEESLASSKRVRKNASRLARADEQLDPNSPEDAHRSKFLERNRVAASKCRQKKKEWTQNLERRARDLQRENHSLRMLLDTCREEILFLKGEMLKHTACGCVNIQEYLQRGAMFSDDQNDNPIQLERTGSVATPPRSPASSGALRRDGQKSEPSFKADPEADETGGDRTLEENLEALLRPQCAHDTSEEGIAKQVQVS